MPRAPSIQAGLFAVRPTGERSLCSTSGYDALANVMDAGMTTMWWERIYKSHPHVIANAGFRCIAEVQAGKVGDSD
jgi:hypothetical protein